MRRFGWLPLCDRALVFALTLALSSVLLAGCEGAAGGGDTAGGEGASCDRSADCPSGQLCLGGVCRATGGGGSACTNDGACGYGQRCVDGRCVFGADECSDDLDCVTVPGGVCDDGTCSYPQQVGCQDDDDCPEGEICDRDTGDCAPPVDPCADGCADDDPCTEDTCGAEGCVFTPIEGCCRDDAACDDGNPCTADVCVDNACTHAPTGDPACCVGDADCDDGDPGTVDRCEADTCVHLPPCATSPECDDGDTCTTDRCADGGCLNEWVPGCCHVGADCNDGDPCTADRCVDGGCQYTAAPGCCETDADCDDGNVCTVNTCDAASGDCRTEAVPGCCESPADCDDGDPCTTDTCGADGACANDAVPGCCDTDADCDDGVACTSDTCGADQTCTNAWIPDCCTTAADCADGDPCTTDTCGEGGLCTNPRVPGCCSSAGDCDDGDPCTQDRCNANTCESVPDPDCCAADGECDDGDFCTVDACVDNACDFAPIEGCCDEDGDCDDGLAATVDTCDPRDNVCTHERRTTCAADGECDDGDPCTEDRCEAERCAWYVSLDPACRCALESECETEEVCSLVEAEDGGIWGYCFAPAGDLPMGTPCDPETPERCESGLCLELMGTTVCFGACDVSGDCAAEAACRSIGLPSGGDAGDHEMNLCVPPPIPCTDDGGCPADMYCDGFTVPEAPGELVMGCLYADETLRRTGEPCASDAECNSGFCLTDEVQGGVCFGLCDDDGDCQAGQRCYEDHVRLTLSMGTETTADDRDVTMPACAWDFGTLDPCAREADCGGAEVCFPLLNDAETAFDPACLLPPADTTTPPGGTCSANAQCQSGVCVSGLYTDRCLQFCVSSADCASPTTCETVTFILTNDDGSETEIPATVCVD